LYSLGYICVTLRNLAQKRRSYGNYIELYVEINNQMIASLFNDRDAKPRVEGNLGNCYGSWVTLGGIYMSNNKQSNAGGRGFIGEDFVKSYIIVLLILVCIGMIYYFAFIKRIHITFTHFFYIPIILAGYSWGKQSIWVALFLGICLMVPYVLSVESSAFLLHDILRAVLFVVIAWVIGSLKEYSLYSEKRFTGIIEGNPIPTFIIDKDHIITHFNNACEVLTGFAAEDMIGTRKQWMPFFSDERPILADIIVDGASEEEVFKYYGGLCGRSSLIQRAYDGEVYYSGIGIKGKWLHITAAPLRNTAGEIIGAIETLVDITERKRVEEELNLQKGYFQQLFDNSPEAIVLADNMDRVIDANSEFRNLFGYSLEEIKDCFINDIIVPEKRYNEASALSNDVISGKAVKKESVRMRKDGSLVDVYILGCPILINNEQVGIYAIYRDITERKLAGKALRESEERYRLLVELLPEAVLIHSEGKIVFANMAGAKLLGVSSPEELIGESVMNVIHPDYRETARERIRQVLEEKKTASIIEEKFIRFDGTIVDVEVISIYFPYKGKTAMLCVIRDITKRKETEGTIRFQAFHDVLTGLSNRIMFDDRLAMTLARAHRNKEMLAVMFLDLDRFKNINDTLGHTTGDELLISVAKRLTSLVREVDTVARMGGDEFTILLPEISHAEEAAVIAQRIINAFEQPFMIKGHELYITTSIGISIYPVHGDDVETLVKNADAAMYHAKDLGRNNYQYF